MAKRSIFDAVEQLDSQDVTAARKRQITEKEIRKSKAAKSQSKIHGLLMELRILLQRVLQQQQQATESTLQEEECQKLVKQLEKARSIMTGGGDTKNDDNSYETHKERWTKVLNRRHKDLRLHTGITAKAQFKVMDSSFWQQVEAASTHEELRLSSSSSSSDNKFDDAKLYQHMLQDFLAGQRQQQDQQTSTTDAVKRRKATNQPKKNVDRKASKGRKIRYAVIPKMVNFTFPVARPTPDGIDEDEWFKSLFGSDSTIS